MIIRKTPRQADILHHALNFLGGRILDCDLSRHEAEELGCLLLILADYSYLAQDAD